MAKVYRLTPGWLRHRGFIFGDRGAGNANEAFPAHDRAPVLDSPGHLDEFMEQSPPKDYGNVGLDESAREIRPRFAGTPQISGRRGAPQTLRRMR